MRVVPAISAPRTALRAGEARAWKEGLDAIRDRVVSCWPAAAVSGVFMALIAVSVRRGMAANAGHFVYPMDDAYSHMAIGKNLVRHGVWGFSSINGFSSGSSSLLWPLLLAAGFAVFGVHEWVPLVLNIVPAVAFLFYAGVMVRRHTRSGLAALLILSAVMYLTPLPTVAASGMEHCWQLLICLVFLDLAVQVLADDELPAAENRMRWGLPAMSLLMTTVRYEGVFLLGIVTLLLMIRRQRQTAALCACAGGLPIVGFGGYAVERGWHFLPNSLLLKAVAPLELLGGIGAFFTKGYYAMLFNPHMFILVLALVGALLVQWRRHDTLWNRPTLMLSLLLAGTALHLQFAGLGLFYRYEAYLMGIGILFLGFALVDEVQAAYASPRAWFEGSQHLILLALAVVLFCAPLWTRAARAWSEIPQASHNIYEHQYQMAHLIRQSFRGEGVAANDIGAIDFYADIKLVDLWGLGTMEVTAAKLHHNLTHDLARRLLAGRNVRVIMVYPDMAFEHANLPAEWVPVGQWTIFDNLVCAGSTVCFFAPNATMVPKLVDALQSYRARVPADVAQTGLYCGDPLPHVQGTYAAERDGGGTYRWTNEAAQFALYPSNERADAADADSTLELSIRTLSKGVTLDVTLNGRAVARHRCTTDEGSKWVMWPVKVHWREGYNVLNVMAHGGAPVSPAGDDRKLLFAIHEPRWTFADQPNKGYPSPTLAP